MLDFDLRHLVMAAVNLLDGTNVVVIDKDPDGTTTVSVEARS